MNRITLVSIESFHNTTEIGILREGEYSSRKYRIKNAERSNTIERILFHNFTLARAYLSSWGHITLYYAPKLPPQEEAKAALDSLCAYLVAGAPGNRETEPTYWDNDPDGYGPTYEQACTHAVARKMARAILKAAEVQTMGGCPLCMS